MTVIVWVLTASLVFPLGSVQRTVCRDFSSQAAAQAAYRADPTGLANLDADHDGWACESNPAPFDCEPVPEEQRVGPIPAADQVRPPRGCVAR